MVKFKKCYIRFFWGLLTFSLCISTLKACRQQSHLGRHGTSKPRSSFPSASATLLEDEVMVIAVTSSVHRQRKNSPEYLRPGQGETKASVQGRVDAGFPCSAVTDWEPTCCRDCAPSSAQPLYLPWRRIKPSASKCMWRLRLHFCSCIAPDSQRRFAVQLRLEGASGGHLVQKWLSALAQILFVLLHPLQTVQGMLRPSRLRLLTRHLGFKKLGYEIYSPLSVKIFQSAAICILKAWSGTAHTPTKFCWRRGASGSKVMRQAT